jgi:hypothetical protein
MAQTSRFKLRCRISVGVEAGAGKPPLFVHSKARLPKDSLAIRRLECWSQPSFGESERAWIQDWSEYSRTR